MSNAVRQLVEVTTELICLEMESDQEKQQII